MFNGDVLTQVDLAAVIDAAPRAQGASHDRADAGRQPDGLRAGRDRRGRQHPALSREAERRRDHAANTINAGIYVLEPDTFDRIPKDTPWSIERSFFPSFIERGETFVAYRTTRLLDRHRHAGRIHAGPSRHHGRPRSGTAVCGPAGGHVFRGDGARVEDGAVVEGPCFSRRRHGRAGRRVRRAVYSVLGTQLRDRGTGARLRQHRLGHGTRSARKRR